MNICFSYEHLKISHYVGQSSAARRNKVEELPVPVDEEGIKAILGRFKMNVIK